MKDKRALFIFIVTEKFCGGKYAAAGEPYRQGGGIPFLWGAGASMAVHVDEAGTVRILSCSGTPVKVRVWIFWNWIM